MIYVEGSDANVEEFRKAVQARMVSLLERWVTAAHHLPAHVG